MNQSAKIGIVIPLKSKLASRNWDATCHALSGTVRSLAQQTSDRFVSIIVGHEQPDLSDSKSKTPEFHSIETQAPTLTMAREFATDNRLFTLDKNRKIVRGMQLLSSHHVDYWFTLDADDVIDRDFVKEISLYKDAAGMILKQGYLFYSPLNRYRSCSEMEQLCGSTSVLSAAEFSLPSSLDEKEIGKVPWCCYSHMHIASYFRDQLKKSPVLIQKPLVGYVLGHGDNCSDGFRESGLDKLKTWLKPRLLGKAIPDELGERFGLSQSDIA